MARCGAAAVPEQPEGGFQRSSPSALVPLTASLQRRTLGLGFA
jgi:hypothetical protein